MTTTIYPLGARSVPITYAMEHVYQVCRFSMCSHSLSTVFQIPNLRFLVSQGALHQNVVCQQPRGRVHSLAVVQPNGAI